jgi:outer membrane protein TolC
MNLPSLRRFPKLTRLPWLAAGICMAGVGCQQPMIAVAPAESPAVVARAAAPEPAAAAPTTLPISLEMVFRLACEQNSQIGLAREKLSEACAQKDVADLAWLPNVYVGTSYWRHDGGIVNEDGTLTHSSFNSLFSKAEINVSLDAKEAAYQKLNANRQIWQRKGELSKITSETLLEAATTYIDVLLARTSEAIGLQLDSHETRLLGDARKLLGEPWSELLVEALEMDIRGHKAAMAKVHQQGDAAALKLAMLLGLDPNVKLVPIDDRLAPFALADTTAPVEDLVSRALANGPGIRELEGLLGVVQDAIEKAKGPGMLMPIIELRVAEGGFGAGPGDDMRWDNRMDAFAQLRWNLTDFCKGNAQRRVAESKLHQLYLTQKELHEKLTIGVHEARSAVFAGEQQIRLGADQTRHAVKVYKLSEERRHAGEAKDKYTEVQVLQALRALELAQVRYLEAVSGYDKAQLRLLILTGATNCETPPPGQRASNLPKPADPGPPPVPAKGKEAEDH